MSNNVYQNILVVNEDNNIGFVDVLSVSRVGSSDVMLFVDVSFSWFISTPLQIITFGKKNLFGTML